MIQREQSAFRGQLGKMIGFLPDREKSNSLSRAGSNVLPGGAGRTGGPRGLCAGAPRSSPTAARGAFPGRTYEGFGRLAPAAAPDGADGRAPRDTADTRWH